MVIFMHFLQHWLKWIDQETGRRSDVAHSYIHPALDRSHNVHLLPGCAVRKVIIEYVPSFPSFYVVLVTDFARSGTEGRREWNTS